jgi:hypothetical protein
MSSISGKTVDLNYHMGMKNCVSLVVQKLVYWSTFNEVCSCLWVQTVASNALIAAQGDVAMAVDRLSSQE